MSKHAQRSSVSQHQFWESLYKQERVGWNLGTPTPVFEALITQGEFQPGTTVCIPGAGLGYDAVLFAQAGFQVTALEFAPTAIQHQRDLAESAGVNLEICECDIFNLPTQLNGKFNYVVEYVTLCAVDPDQRTEFARVMKDLLKPGGQYISLLFPIEDRPGGPPFGLNENETIETFESVGFTLKSTDVQSETIKPRRGREKLLVFQKER